MKEYEYSFKVDKLKPYIDYCEKEKYKKIKEVKQTRDLYTNGTGINARITISKTDKNQSYILDFKEEDDSDKVLKDTKESLPLQFDKNNLKAVYTIIDILGYKKIKHLVRNRIVYEKSKVKFEIDKYSSPEKMNVVAIEGNKSEVDKIYNIISETISLKK